MGKGRSHVAEQVKPLLCMLKGWEVKAGIAEQRISGVQSRAGGRAGLKGSQEGAPADWGWRKHFSKSCGEAARLSRNASAEAAGSSWKSRKATIKVALAFNSVLW